MPQDNPIRLRAPSTRRGFMRRGAGMAAALALPWSAPIVRAATDELRVGFVSPQSGPVGIFGDGDPYVMDLVRAKHPTIEAGGKTWRLRFVNKDTQSSPVRAAAVAKELIHGDKVDLVLATSTPEAVNPVADACEAEGMPALSSTAPWEAYYFGRGARPGEPSPFKWTYHFSFGVGNFARLYADQWSKVPTNRRVGMLLPGDADGNAIRAMLIPSLQKAGFTIIDAGPYQNGTTDFSAQIQLFRRENVEIFNTFPFPPDFAVFWRQAAQRGLARQIKICQMAKAGLFAPELEALGALGDGLHAGAYWHRAFPFTSPATGLGCRELADGYERVRRRQWNQQVGATASLFDAALAALRSCPDPKDRAAVAASLARLKADTAVGHVDFTAGPVPNCTPTGVVGVQWVRTPGGPNAFELEIVANVDQPQAPITRTMTAYTLQG